MRKVKFFIPAAAIMLAITAFVTSKGSSRRFAGFSTAVTAGGGCTVKSLSNIFTTVAAGGSQVYMCCDVNQKVLLTKVNKTKIAYLK